MLVGDSHNHARAMLKISGRLVSDAKMIHSGPRLGDVFRLPLSPCAGQEAKGTDAEEEEGGRFGHRC